MSSPYTAISYSQTPAAQSSAIDTFTATLDGLSQIADRLAKQSTHIADVVGGGIAVTGIGGAAASVAPTPSDLRSRLLDIRRVLYLVEDNHSRIGITLGI